MAYSKVTITFALSMPLSNQYLNIGESTRAKNFVESFVPKRLQSYEVSTPTLIAEDTYTGYLSTFYKQSFDLDHNAYGEYTVQDIQGAPNSGFGQVVITANYPGAVFYVILNEVDGAFVNISNQPAIPEVKINTVTYSSATSSQCQYVKVNVATSILATKVLSPVVIDPNSTNPFSFDFLRGQNINILVEDSNGKQDSKSVLLPSMLNASNFTITTNNSPNGATVIITNSGLSGLDLQYSLDNVVWQAGNSFSGLVVGDYTMYIKDQLGCSISIAFHVDEFNITEPYFLYPKSNSIRMAKREAWDYVNVFKTDENTLSCESDVDLPYKEVQEWQSSDEIRVQFRSNYNSNIVTLIDSNNVETVIPTAKKTKNIGIKDKRDAIQYNLGSGKTGIFFQSGNTYDFDTGLSNGTYSLLGGVPEWGRIGNYLNIGTAWFEIEQIRYDESKLADVLIISNVYTGVEAPVIVGSIYNRENFEVYEFTVNMINYINNDFRVRLVCTSTGFPELTFLSEQINVQTERGDLLEIKYKNSENTDVNFSTGIEFLIRVPYNRLGGRYSDESETYKTDTTAMLLGSELFEEDEILFEPNTKEIWRKINIALSHDTVKVNGVDYVKASGFTSEGPLGETNLYVLTAGMIKTGNVYSSKSNDSFGYTDDNIEIPKLIKSDVGYIEY